MVKTARPLHRLWIVILTGLSIPVAADEIRLRVGSSDDNSVGSHEWSNGDTRHTLTDDRFGPVTYNPTADQRRRMRIEWAKPSVGYVDFDRIDGEEEAEDPPWVESSELRPERQLLISGRLLLESPDGKSAVPVPWVRGVNVVVARQPRVRLDWSRRQHEETAAESQCVLNEDGRFHARFNIHEVLRTPGRVEPFQVGLSLGTKEGNTITWTNTVPVLPQSVSTIRLPGPPVLSPTQRIINGAHQFPNPLGLVRAVNHLHGLGNDRAIAELREFAKTAPTFQPLDASIPENIDTADPELVDLIVLLLFDPADGTDDRPQVWHVNYHNADGEEIDRSVWPRFPLVVQDGLPFRVAWGEISLGGQPPEPDWMVDWAQKHGKLRARPLEPGSDPFAAADQVQARLEVHRLWPMRWYRKFNWQQEAAWTAILEACAGLPADKQPPQRLVEIKDEHCWAPDWAGRRTFAASLNLRWNPERQAYDAR